jgi:hypothetical protein
MYSGIYGGLLFMFQFIVTYLRNQTIDNAGLLFTVYCLQPAYRRVGWRLGEVAYRR